MEEKKNFVPKLTITYLDRLKSVLNLIVEFLKSGKLTSDVAIQRFNDLRVTVIGFRLIAMEHNPMGFQDLQPPQNIAEMLNLKYEFDSATHETVDTLAQYVLGVFLDVFRTMLEDNINTEKQDKAAASFLRARTQKLRYAFFPRDCHRSYDLLHGFYRGVYQEFRGEKATRVSSFGI